MPYLFGNPDPVEEQPKTSIFGDGQTVAAPNVGTSQPNVGSSSGSVGSSIPAPPPPSTNSSAGGGTGTVPSAVNPQVNPSGVAQKMASLSARQKAPDLSGYSANLSAQEQKLQAEANSYTGQAQANAEKLSFDQGQTQKAIDGDLDAYKALAARLSNTKAPQVEAFKGLGDFDAGTANLQNPYSQASLLRGSSPSYTGGQRAFDAKLLGRNAGFQSEARGLIDREAALQKASDTEAVERTKAAQDLQQSYLDIGSQQTRTFLGNSNKDLAFDLQLREAQAEAERLALNPAQIAGDLGQELSGEIRQDFKNADPRSLNGRSLEMLNPAQDLSSYLNIDRDVDWKELVTETEAERYNRVLGLLGDGGQAWVAGGGAGDPYAFNRAGAKEALFSDAVSRRSAQDLADQKALEEALAGSRGNLDNEIAAYQAAKKDPSFLERSRERVIDGALMPIEFQQQFKEGLKRGLPGNMKGAAEMILNPVTPSNQLEENARELAKRATINPNRLKFKTKW
jgi:hypothetical protein